MKLTKTKDLSLPTGVLGLVASVDSRRLFAACMDGGVYECDVESGKWTLFAEKHAKKTEES